MVILKIKYHENYPHKKCFYDKINFKLKIIIEFNKN